MTKAFLTVEIDRIEEFINNSRKTLDSWLGSYIISYLMGCVCKSIEDEFGQGCIVYPDVKALPMFEWLSNGQWPVDTTADMKRISTFPDRATAIVEFEDKAVICAKIRRIQEAAEANWQTICDDAREYLMRRIATKAYNLCDKDIWDRQCRGFFQLHWAVSAFAESQDEVVYRLHRQLCDAVNRSRPFALEAQPGLKCSLCGYLSALPVGMERWQANDAWKSATASGQFGRLFGRTERLSAVYAAKRLSGRAFFEENLLKPGESAFPSVFSVASAVFRGELITKGPESAVEAFNEELKGLLQTLNDMSYEIGMPKHRALALGSDHKTNLARIDGEWLYPDAYSVDRILREYELGPQMRSEIAERSQSAVKGLNDLVKACEVGEATSGSQGSIPHVSSYFAVLEMDGDQIGKLMESPDRLEKTTKALADFGLRIVPSVVHGEHYGVLEYAGGDELRVFLPVSEILPVLIKLRYLFSSDDPNAILSCMGLYPSAVTPNESPVLKGCTMSAGIAIAHARSSLRHTIRAAHDAVNEAKENGRNRVEVVLLKRSGAPVKVGWGFSNSDTSTGPEIVIARSVSLLKSNHLSRKFFYDLNQNAEILSGLPKDCWVTDTVRLLKRHFPVGNSEEKKRLRDDYTKLMLEFLSAGQEVGPSKFVNLAQLIDWLAKEGRK